jgi:hypothetical protein
LVSAVGHMSESFENRGPNKAVEFGAYEVRMLTEMLWKGSVVMLEVRFNYHILLILFIKHSRSCTVVQSYNCMNTNFNYGYHHSIRSL